MKTSLHDMHAIPKGMTVGDILPIFAGVKHDIHLGTPNSECASCRKKFTLVRKRRKNIRLYPAGTKMPIAIEVGICGACLSLHHKCGSDRDAVLASVQAFVEGLPADQ